MLHRHKSKDAQRKFSPPGPTYMSHDQVASYLKDLRTNRPARPSGSRPIPTKTPMSTPNLEHDLPPRASSALSMSRDHDTRQSIDEEHPRASSAMSHRRHPLSISLGSSTGRPLVQEPVSSTVRKHTSVLQTNSRATPVSPSATYREIAERRAEREEARSLRDALEEMDLQDEQRLHKAAQDEATELVWRHQHPREFERRSPEAPYHNPDWKRAYHERGKSYGHLAKTEIETLDSRRHSYRSTYSDSVEHKHVDFLVDSGDHPHGANEPLKKHRVNFQLPNNGSSATISERIHGSAANNDSKGIFRNPNDQIYEEPEEGSNLDAKHGNNSNADATSALKAKPKNFLPSSSRPLVSPVGRRSMDEKRIQQSEIQKNPPSQLRNPVYKTNELMPQARGDVNDAKAIGIEFRSDEIRAATSKRLKDRSTNLPMPSAVSDRPGRPIVSFDPSWKPAEETQPQTQSHWENLDNAKAFAPLSPSPGAAPPPTIHISESPDASTATKSPQKEFKAPVAIARGADRSMSGPGKNNSTRESTLTKQVSSSQTRWLSTYSRAGLPTAACAACSLPIAGKVVTAAGSRFHPECFVCHNCHTALECVAFYQEPETKRLERLEGISKDNDEAHVPRFYCHLDFHELFSPRCKSCKTPIEGEVVVACGAEWHVGHFFCAECGDTFSPTTPFVEKEGFAWCLRCHSRRTAPRCLGCKQPVLDEVIITAIGGQWHERCFVCHECGNGFGPEGRFFVHEGEPRKTAKGRILGGPVQLASCEQCEGIRLKASN